MIQAPSPAERLEKLEYISNKEERRKELLQLKVIHPAISNSYPDLEARVEHFFAQQLNMPRREIDDGKYVAKLLQTNTVLVKLSDERLNIFLL